MNKKLPSTLYALVLLALATSPPCQAPPPKGANPRGKAAPAWRVFEPPAQIAVEQSVKGAPEGWKVAFDDRPNVLAGVTFYDGPPEEMASLVYETQRTAGRRWIATWAFDPEAPGGTWVEFHYAGTTAMLRKRLPEGVRAAEVTCDRDQHVDGYEKILTIRIR